MNSPLSSLSDAVRAPQQYWMPSHVRACPVASGAIVLDLKRNRYFGLGVQETRALFTLEPDWSQAHAHGGRSLEPLPPDEALKMGELLVEAGFLSRHASEESLAIGAIELHGMLTSVGHEVGRSTSIGFGYLSHFLRACLWARRSIKSRTLYSVAREIGELKKARAQPFDTPRAIELACVFRRLRPFAFAAKDQCLFHALALVKFLSYYQVFPTWVIGVRARPWAAHSWVQQGNLLLDSNPESICEYTPLLTV